MIGVEIDSTLERMHVALSGELDADNAATLFQHVTSEHEAPADALIDLQDLEFIDSSGISVLLKVRDVVVQRGGSFLVSDPKPGVRRIFDIAGLLDVFGLDEAVRESAPAVRPAPSR